MATMDIFSVVNQQELINKVCSKVVDEQSKHKIGMQESKTPNNDDKGASVGASEQSEMKNLLLEIKSTINNLGSIVAVAATTAVSEAFMSILPALEEKIKKEIKSDYEEKYKDLSFYCQDRAIEAKIKTDDLECYNRRENLRFFNIKEEEGEKKDSSITKKKC